ncbi:hypothetical protein B9479_006077 [Cryptococcus floricola]|uniref:Uncharacterized protein n=1 Tax=Cryptococcus floricola TaxID=2591691 RepID=A0A5D3AT21_9TREE|nr:hypothetical protein B9479_006077 [Cryptococcus floricola]
MNSASSRQPKSCTSLHQPNSTSKAPMNGASPLHPNSCTSLHQPNRCASLHFPEEVPPIIANERQHEQLSKPAPRRSGRIEAKKPQQPPTAPQVVSQQPALLDEAILLEFDQYVRQAWNPAPIPTDERLEGWSDLRLGDLLRLKLPQPLSLEVAFERYPNLLDIIEEADV